MKSRTQQVRKRYSICKIMFALAWVPLAILSLDNGQACELPQDLFRAITSNYTKWRILQISDLSPYEQQAWRQARGSECPGFAEGSFKMPGKKGYFCLLVPIKRNFAKQGYCYKLIYAEMTRHGFRLLQIQRDGPISNAPVIWRTDPGELTDIETGKKADPRADFLILEYMESSSQAFYWNGKKFSSILYTM